MQESRTEDASPTDAGCVLRLKLPASLRLHEKPWEIFHLQKTVADTCVPMLFHEPGVKTAYRLENKSWFYYLCSIFQLHNESVNIWTHLIGSIYLMIFTLNYSDDLDSMNPFRAIMLNFFICCATCTAISTCAHTFHSKSQFLHYFFYSIDYAGIGCYMFGSSILTFYCSCHYENYPIVDKYFIPINIALSWCSFVCCCVAKLRYRRPYPFQRKLWNLCSFGFQVSFTLQFFMLRYFACWSDDSCAIPSLSHYQKAFMLMLMSVFFFSSHLPEKMFPGRFDIVGIGHQIFHVLILFQYIEQFKGASEDVNNFSTVTDKLPEASDITTGLVTYLVVVIFTLILLVPLIHKRVISNQLFELELKAKCSD